MQYKSALVVTVVLCSMRPRSTRTCTCTCTCTHMYVHTYLAFCLWRRERCVLFLFRWCGFLPLNVAFLEFGEKAIPRFMLQLWILRELPLDHHCLDVVNGMYVLHCVLHHLTSLNTECDHTNVQCMYTHTRGHVHTHTHTQRDTRYVHMVCTINTYVHIVMPHIYNYIYTYITYICKIQTLVHFCVIAHPLTFLLGGGSKTL